MSHIPEDRIAVGGAKSCSIMENIMLDRYYEKQYCRGGILEMQDEMRRHAEQLISEFAIKLPNSEYALGTHLWRQHAKGDLGAGDGR